MSDCARPRVPIPNSSNRISRGCGTQLIDSSGLLIPEIRRRISWAGHWETGMEKQIRVSIIAAPEVEPWIAVGIHDAFWAVGTLWNRVMGESECPRFIPEIVAEKSGVLQTATGVRIEPHRTFEDCANTDIVFAPSVLISSGQKFGRENPGLVNWVRRAYANGALVVSACTGSFLLAEAGLLDDRDATTHWAFVDLMRREYPRVRVHADRVLVSANVDERIVTSGGATSWTDLVLYLI